MTTRTATYRLLCLSGAVTLGALGSTLMAGPASADLVPAPIGSLLPAPVSSAVGTVPVPVLPAPLPAQLPEPAPAPTSPGPALPGAPAPAAPAAPKAPVAPAPAAPAPAKPAPAAPARSTTRHSPVVRSGSAAGPAALPAWSTGGLAVGSLTTPPQAVQALPELADSPVLAAPSAPLAAPAPQLTPRTTAAPQSGGTPSLPAPLVVIASVAVAGAATTQLAQMRARRVRA